LYKTNFARVLDGRVVEKSRENRSSGSEEFWPAPSPELSGESGERKHLASENPNPLPRLRLRGLDLTRQVAPGASFPLAVPIEGAWPDWFQPVPLIARYQVTS
jgi:hypothetical protein